MREAYPLEALLRLRRTIRGSCERALQRSARRLQETESRLRQSRRRAEAKREEIAETSGRSGSRACSAGEMQLLSRYLRRLSSELAHLEEAAHSVEAERQGCLQAADAARQALILAEKELEVVEKNHKAWSERRRREELERAERELEDLTAQVSLMKHPGSRSK